MADANQQRDDRAVKRQQDTAVHDRKPEDTMSVVPEGVFETTVATEDMVLNDVTEEVRLRATRGKDGAAKSVKEAAPNVLPVPPITRPIKKRTEEVDREITLDQVSSTRLMIGVYVSYLLVYLIGIVIDFWPFHWIPNLIFLLTLGIVVSCIAWPDSQWNPHAFWERMSDDDSD